MAMIKLVLSDLDGTLLKKSEDFVNENLLNLIKKFKENNIIFAIESGRSYTEMREILHNLNDIYYVCSDGAAVVYNDEIIFKKCIDEVAIKRMFDKKNIVFHSVDFSYYRDVEESLKKTLYDKYKGKVKKAESIEELKEVVKISKYGAEFTELPPFSNEVYKDKEWCEWINNSAGKGKATEFLQKRFDISIRETAAFGDNYNDIGMFQRAAEKYVMKNAPSCVRMISNRRVEDIEKEFYSILKR